MQESNPSPVITNKRRHSAAFKRKLLELIEQPGTSVGGIALERRVYAINGRSVWCAGRLLRLVPALKASRLRSFPAK
jgi:hypothetical protein